MMVYISEKELKIVLDIIKKFYSKCNILAFVSRYRVTHKKIF